MSQKKKLGCCEAHFAVMRYMVAQTALSRVKKMDTALKSALELYPYVLDDQSSLTPRFRILCKALGPRIAFRVREGVIDFFKPQLRTSFGR